MRKVFFYLSHILLFGACASVDSKLNNEISNSESQGKLRATFSVPQNSGIAFVTYKDFILTADSLLISEKYTLADSAKRINPKIIERFVLSKQLSNRFKLALSSMDSIQEPTNNSCVDEMFGETRFFFSFEVNEQYFSGFLTNIYRENIFDVVNILNEAYPKGNLIGYDKKALIEGELDCSEKGWKTSFNLD